MPLWSFDDLVSRIRSEYVEMPGLWLTADQATRLWGLDPNQCKELLQVLIAQDFLTVRADGKYGRAGEGQPVTGTARMQRRDLP